MFLEHDRSQESAGSFRARKAERYANLARFGLAARLLGFPHFTEWVTVADPAGRPLARIRALQAVSREAAMLRFTLADWVRESTPSNSIWWTPTTQHTTRDGAPEVKDVLDGPFALPDECEPWRSASKLHARLVAARSRSERS